MSMQFHNPDAWVFATIGEDGFRRLVAAFYAQVPGDSILGPMYPKDDLTGAQDRLLHFLIFRFGGPEDYIRQRGHPRLRARHFPFAIDQAARDRWMTLMDKALTETMLPENVTEALRTFFAATATHMMNR